MPSAVKGARRIAKPVFERTARPASRRIAKSASEPVPEAASEPIIDPVQSARAAGLRYVSDRQPGLRRLKTAKGFRYVDPEGAAVRDKDTLARIKSLVIPPAWRDVWICKHANGHLQTTGRDARGRKQSRYHPHWREVRDATKYERMALFAQALPKIRERVEEDLRRPGMPREKVLATIVRLMETTHIRVGNDEYAKENGSYGLTTMRNKHVQVHGSTITFDFKGKSGVHHAIDLEDKRLARIIKRCEEIPGYELFQFIDHDGNHHHLHSHDVNDYLRDITGEHFTAKDFRTWAGSVLANELLMNFEPFTTATQAKKNVVQAITAVAAQLGNTPSVCRKCYVHPAVLEAYLSGHMTPQAKAEVEEIKQEIKEVKEEIDKEIAGHEAALRREEQALVSLLQQKLLIESAAA